MLGVLEDLTRARLTRPFLSGKGFAGVRAALCGASATPPAEASRLSAGAFPDPPLSHVAPGFPLGLIRRQGFWVFEPTALSDLSLCLI